MRVLFCVSNHGVLMHCCYRYIDVYQPANSRKKALMQTYFFLCECPPCSVNEPAQDGVIAGLRCRNNTLHTHALLSTDQNQQTKWTCPQCEYALSEREATRTQQLAMQRFSSALSTLQFAQNNSSNDLARSSFEAFLLEYQPKLMPTHYLLKRALVHLAMISYAEGRVKEASELLSRALLLLHEVWSHAHEHIRQHQRLLSQWSSLL